MTFGFWRHAAFMVLAVVVCWPVQAQQISEAFRTNGLTNAWTFSGNSCLTVSGGTRACSSSATGNGITGWTVTNYNDDSSNGWLRLVNSAANLSGTAYLNQSFALNSGLSITFTYAMYGGQSDGNSQGDGFSLYLINPSAASAGTGGRFGGGLGYCRINGGVIGLGFDVYGNFTVASDSTNGCNGTGPGVQRSNISVRAGQAAATAWNYLSGTGAIASSVLRTDGSWTQPPVNFFGTVSTCATASCRRSGSQVNVTFYLDSTCPAGADSYRFTVNRVPATGTPIASLCVNSSVLGAIPSTLNIGFAGGTGAATQWAEIRDLTVAPIADVAIAKSNGVAAVSSGSSTTYALTVTNAGPGLANGTVLTDPAVAGLSTQSVTCTVPAGSTATCPAAGTVTVANLQGAGIAISNFPPNSSLVFNVTATVTAASVPSVSNTARISAGASPSYSDPNAANNSSTDTDALNPQIALLKSVAGRVAGTDDFTVQIQNGATVVASASTGGTNGATTGSQSLAAGTAYTLTEIAAGTPAANLASYTTTIRCTNAFAASTTVLPANNAVGRSFSITPQAGDNITCTLTNTPTPPTLILRKAISPLGRAVGTDQFALSIAHGASVDATATTGGSGSVCTGCATSLVTGIAGTAYTLSETGAGTPAANLARYTTTYSCTNGGSGGTVIPSGTGTSMTVTPAYGDVIDCTFTNTVKRSLIVRKSLSPTTDAGQFVMNANGVLGAAAGDGATAGTLVDIGATVTFSEAGSGATNLANYSTAYSCNTTPPTTGATTSGSFTMPATDVTCTLTNTRKTHTVTVRKSLVPASDSGKFNLQINGTTVAANAGDGGTGNTPGVAVGSTVNVAELAGASTTLGLYTTNLSCPGTTLATGAANQSGSFTMPDADVTCTFSNTHRPTVTATKTASVNPLAVGASGQSYRIAITIANGPTTAPVTIADSLPNGITLAGAPTLSAGGTLSGCPTSGSSLAGCSIATGLANGTYTLTVPIAVAAAAIGSNGGANTANLAGGGDPNCTPASSEACDPTTGTVAVNNGVALSVVKTGPSSSLVVGAASSYGFVLTNSGTGVATAATVVDAIPAGLIYNGFSGANWTCTPANGTGPVTVTCNYSSTTGIAANGGTDTALTIQVTPSSAAAGTSVTNRAATDPTGGNTPPNPTTCTAQDTPAGCAAPVGPTPVNASADIAMTKTVSNASPNVGETVTFTVTAANHGPNDATGVAITDALPAGLTFVSATPSQGTYNNTTGLWTIGALANGANATLQITATVIQTGAITNTATKSAGDQFDPNTGNNAGSASLNAQPSADLQVSKTASTATPNLGANVTFTVTVHNGGPNDATGVVIDDLLPAGLNFVSATPSVGTYDGATGVWTLGALANGADATLTMVATVGMPGELTNTASIAAADQHDPNPANNSAGATVNGQSADIQLLKTVDQPNPTRGNTVTFTITATNQGPSAATGVRVSDVLPTGLTFVSATPSQGAYDNATGLWTIGNLAASGAGATATLTITATVDADAGATNTARLDAIDQTDPNPANNSASATVTPIASADVSVIKTGSANAGYGEAISYTLVIANAGPSVANGTTFSDDVPAGITNVAAACGAVTGGAVCTAPTVTGNAVSGTIGALPVGGSVTITVTGRAPTNGASVSNSATAQPPTGTTDPTPTNNTSTATTILLQPQLSLTKSATPTPFTVGQPASYTITVTNNGAGPTAGDLTVSDTLPTGVTLASASGANWSCTGTSALTCTFTGTLAAGAGTTLSLNVNVDASATSGTNTARVEGGGDSGCPTDARCSGSTPNVPVNASADVSVAKTGPATAIPGTNVTYQLVVSNAGPSTAAAVGLADPTPAGLSFVSADAPCAGGFPCALGDLAAGASVTVNVTYAISSGQTGVITNTATVSSPTHDPDPADNSSTATTALSGTADVAIVKTATPSPVTAAATLTYTLVVTNHGPSDANGTTVSDTLPAGLTNASASCGNATGGAVCGAFDNTVAGAITALPAGGSATITITATAPDDATTLANTATVTPPAGVTDPTPGNNTSTVNTPVSPSANLSIAKSGPATLTSGGVITYTLLIRNAGPSAANGATYSDAVPAGITGLTASCGSPTGGAVCANPSVAGNTVSGSVPTLPSGGSATITITGTAPIGAQALTNTASVVPPNGTTDPNPADNTSGVTTDISSAADIAMMKTVDNASPNVGETVTFTVTATNDGPNDATGVAVTDALPAGLVFVSATPSQGTYNNTTGLWTIGALANGANATLTITATVIQTGAITNTATKSAGDQFDPNSGNNAGSASLNAQPSADLQVSKTASTATPNLGANVTFTVTVHNGGPNDASGVVIDDLLPAGLNFVSATPSQGTYDGATGVWTLGALANGADAALTMVATVGMPGELTNTASVAASDQHDPNPANNSAGVTVNGQSADIQVLKTVDQPNPTRGDTVTFTITATNQGPSAATGVRIEDALPAGLTFVSATPSQGTYDNATGLWTIGNLAASGAGATATLTITATVDTDASATNTARLDAIDQTDPNPANNSASATLMPIASADVSVTKTGPASAGYGEAISYDVVISNHGPSMANGTTFSDDVPAGITNVAAACGAVTGGAVCAAPTVAGNAVTGTIATLPAGGSVTITITGNAPTSGTSVSNSATAQPPTGTTDADPSNNIGTATTTLLQPQLAIAKTATPTPFTVGQPASYTITVANDGAGPTAGDITVNDTLPVGITLASASGANWSCTGASALTCTFTGKLAAGASTTLTLNVTVDASATSGTNTATMEGGGDPSCPGGTNCGGSTPDVPVNASADVSVAKTGPATATPGTNVTYQLVVSNTGPSTATAVSLADPTPAGLSFVSADAPCAGGFPCALGDLAMGASVTVNVTYAIPSGQIGAITNTATATSTTGDPNPGNDTSSATTSLSGTADLELVKTATPSPVTAGATLTYTLVVSNHGPSDADGATVSDPLPAGLTAAAASCGNATGGAVCGTFDNTVAGAITALPAGASATITITATAPNDATTLTNAAAVAPPAGVTDPTPGNNQSSVDTPVSASANLSLTKTGPATAMSGGAIAYTLLVRNAGPSAANGATYSDAVPAGITGVTASCGAPSGGAVCASPSVAGNTVSGTLPTLPSGGSVAITITGTAPIGAQALTNTASVVPPSGTADPDPSDDTSSVTTEIGAAADIAVSKTVDNAAPNVGETVTFTVTAINNGPNDATGVEITDGLPLGLSFVSATPSQGSYDNATGLWTAGALANGASATLAITARVTQAGAITNTAMRSGGDQVDPNTSNSSGSASLNAGTSADIQVGKTVDNATPNLGANASFTITVTNAGPSPATGVNVTDVLPAGLTFVSATPSVGTYDNATGLWTVGNLAAGANETLTIVATVAQAGEITNTATGAANEPDPNPGNNSHGVTINGQSADIQVVKTVDVASPIVGGTVVYTVTVTNNGPSAATNVTATDALPAGLTFVSAMPSQGAYANATGLWTIGDLAASGAGATATLTITATVNPDQAGRTITNTATSTGGDQTDPNAGNDESSVPIVPQGQADLSVVKSGPAQVSAGAQVTYRLVVSNAGPSTAGQATLTDPTPAGLSFVSADAPCAAGFPCNLGDVAAGASVTVNATYAIPSNYAGANPIQNVATVSSATGDPDGSNDTSTATTPVNRSADVQVTKTGPTGAAAGGAITYAIVVTNHGPSDADGATVSDPLPAGLTNASASCGGETGGAICGAFDNTVAGTIATLPAGGSATITISATAPPTATTLTNTATVAPPTGVTDPDTGNNTSAAVVTEVGAPLADLSVRKSGPTVVAAGTTLVYTVVVTNAGPNAAAAVQVADPTPPGLTFVGNSGDCTTAYPCALGDLASGASVTITSTYELPLDYAGPNPIANTATATSATADPNATNNAATAQTSVDTSGQVADMMAAGAATQNVLVNTPVTVATTCTNSGPLPAIQATCTVSEPVGPTAVGGLAPAATLATECVPATPVASLAPGATIACTTAFTPTLPGTYTLQTTASSQTADAIPANNVAASLVIAAAPETADLSLSKQGPATAISGGNLVYTLTVTNHGPSPVSDAAVDDPTPAGLSFVSADAPCASGFPCTLGALAVGQTVTITATYATAADFRGTVSNTATVRSGTDDPNPTNGTGTATTTVTPRTPVEQVPVSIDARWMLALMSLLLTLAAGFGLPRRRG